MILANFVDTRKKTVIIRKGTFSLFGCISSLANAASTMESGYTILISKLLKSWGEVRASFYHPIRRRCT